MKYWKKYSSVKVAMDIGALALIFIKNEVTQRKKSVAYWKKVQVAMDIGALVLLFIKKTTLHIGKNL